MQVLVIGQDEQRLIFDDLEALNKKNNLGLHLSWHTAEKIRDKVLCAFLQDALDIPVLLIDKQTVYLLHQDKKNVVKTGLNWQSLAQRIVRAGRKSELILQACKPSHDSTLIDGTAGFGHDGLILAGACAHITLVEKNPVMALLLLFEYQTMSKHPNWQKLLSRLDVIFGNITDSAIYLPKADIIYLDPMFPKESYQAKVSKTMQSLHLLADAPDINEEHQLVQQAWQRLSSAGKLVVKRPINAHFLANISPDYQVSNQIIRFDVYQKFTD